MGKVGRQHSAPYTAPAGTAAVKFYASTNYNWIKWDCAFLQLAGTQQLTLAAGANKQVTCSHTGVTAADDGHVNTATVSGVTSPGGKLPDQTAKPTITVSTPTPPVTNKLGDHVWVDSNRNGVQDSGERACRASRPR